MAAAAAISLGQHAAAAAVDGHACRRGSPWCRHSGDNSCGVSNMSNDKLGTCLRAGDARRIVVVAQ